MSRSTQNYVAVIDDDESLCRSLGRLLRAAGIQSVTYSSAEAFLADHKRPQFDCLLLDIQLTGMSGVELSQGLADAGSTIPVIFSTAHDDPDVRELAIRSGCVAYLRKTESAEAMLTAIYRAIDSRDRLIAPEEK